MSNPKASGIWFGNTAWPSGRSPGAFAKDVFRLENCKTDREKALAFDTWLLRCMNRGPNLFQPAFGSYIKGFDPLTLFTSWAHNECTGWGWVAAEALNAAGVKARRAVAFASGHTFHEAWYKGLDGKEGWHAFDTFQGWYFLNDAGEVASCEELAANPDLVTNPRPGGRARLGHHPERSGVLHRYQVHDLLDVEQPVRGEELSFEAQPGMQFTNLWRPEHPELAMPVGEKRDGEQPGGPHCSISLYDEEGRPRYPEHLPYWRHYVWPSHKGNAVDNNIAGDDAVRYHGAGHLRWQPLQYGADVACEVHNAVFERGTVRPSGPRKHAEVWWRIRVPYLATYLKVEAAMDKGGGGDLVGFAISPDAGKSAHGIHWGPPKGRVMITLPPTQAPSLRGVREFWLRLDMSTQSPQSNLRVRGIHVHVGYQHNMNIQPRLVPGANELYLEAKHLDGVKLETEWNYTHPDGEKSETVALAKPGRAAKSVDPKIERPDDLIMRGVTLTCVPAE
ncbi:MAG: hypothetical protein L6R28_08545 [Planctomycetes bacterium]|nr:hypothetical protein [Planctomycetota bacterium]